MWLKLVIGYCLCVRPDWATKGKWGILDVNDESGLMSDSESQGGSSHLCQLRIVLVVPYFNKN
jgi:hypothetical protein